MPSTRPVPRSRKNKRERDMVQSTRVLQEGIGFERPELGIKRSELVQRVLVLVVELGGVPTRTHAKNIHAGPAH